MATVLRLGHRRGRDDRISTHVGLTARQFGASGIVYSGERDDGMLESLRDVVERWGGPFTVSYREDWRRVIKDFEGFRILLSMYGTSFNEGMEEARQKGDDILVVVGGEKVPSEVYDLVDLNIAVGHQPHSEVAALAILLYEYFDGSIPDEFENASVEVAPNREGKELRNLDEESN